MDLSKVNRLEVIDQHGRMLTLHGVEEVQGVLQDEDRTLKIVLRTQEQTG